MNWMPGRSQFQASEVASRGSKPKISPTSRLAGIVGVLSLAIAVLLPGTALATGALRSKRVPPAITTQPADQSASPGQSATFTAAASGQPVPTVRWQVSTASVPRFTNIGGATSPTLTLTAATVSMNGNSYRAVFTNSAGHATTRAAILTVVAGTLDHLVLSPATASIAAGGSQTYAAEGFDAAGSDLGNVTGATTFTLSPDGSCTGSVCTASNPGTHTVTGADGSAKGTATLNVTTRPFVEFIFSRSEVTAADNCVANDTSVARLDTVVQPYMASLGLTATASVETSPTLQSANACVAGGRSMAASWDQLSALGTAGWTFIDHSADYPSQASTWSAMTPAQMWAETCGSAQVIDSHGLTGASNMYLWPNNTGQPGNINSFALTNYVEPCFGTSRVWGKGVSPDAALTTAPYQQSVHAANGGACNVSSAPCFNVSGFSKHYWTPANIIATIQGLVSGQVMTLQGYVFVTGTNPAYTTNSDRWDCTSSDPNLHWTNNSERYCWTDIQLVLSYLSTSGMGITQPGVVNAAAGRTGYSDTAVPHP